MKLVKITVLVVLATVGLQDAWAQVVGHQEISATEGGLGTGTLSFADYFGTAVASVGDLDRDGVLDLFVGVEGADAGGRDVGSVRGLFMNANGTVKSSVEIGMFQLPAGSLDAGDYFGSAVAGLQDLDGDGFRDIAVGARGDDDGSAGFEESAGAVWILFLDDAGAVLRSQKISQLDGGFGGDLDPADLFGRSVAFLGDLGEDGTRELAVGAPGDDDGGADRGAVWILSLNPDGTVAGHIKVSDGSGLEVDALADYSGFGTAAARIRRTASGELSVAVGSPFAHECSGEFWFVDLKPGVSVSGAASIGAAAGDFAGLLSPGDQLGRAVAGTGDLDDDGLLDVVAGGPGGDDTGDDAGEFWFVGLEPGTYHVIGGVSATSGGFGGRLGPGDRFGQAVAAIGDLDGDGRVDYAVGAPYGDDGAENSGSVYVLFDDRASPVATGEAKPLEDVFVEPYPNPLSGDGVFRVRLSTDRIVRIEVFDVAGRKVATIHEGLVQAGPGHEIPVRASRWPSGTYVYRISAGDHVRTSSFVVLR